MADEIRLRAAGGIGQPDATGGFLDPHGDLEQAMPQRGELRPGELAQGWKSLPQRQHQPVGGRVQHEANLIGPRSTTGGPVRGKRGLGKLDPVLCLTSGTRQALVDHAGAGADQMGDDKAEIQPQAGRLKAGDDPALARPTPGLVLGLGKAANDLVVFSCSVGTHRIRHILNFGGAAVSRPARTES
jgi:hypothetical protein